MPLFILVDAIVVVDVGGPISHGAIVARELITWVVNTRTGTRDMPDGTRVAVDGPQGAVELL